MSTVINAFSLVVTSWGLCKSINLELDPSLAKAGPKQFLTNIGAGITIINNVLAILNNWSLLPTEGLEYFSREILFPLALQTETVIAGVYWPLRLFWIHLIMHNIKDGKSPIPLPVDLSIHLVPILTLLIEYYGVRKTPFQVSAYVVWILTFIISILYNFWLKTIIDVENGQVYPYPFLSIPEPQVTFVFVGITTIGCLSFLAYKYSHPGRRTPSLKQQKLQ
ncbi:HBR493Wp [Eremothecium sinecaudum]|uniref:HBR493Wp n=1 Tax=Eremothecium sinecaudum TaxID=45286 RepID=A0A120K1H6_9SACH|nr:HBR493Wp [Eremothecium sinecaudum]AMD19394.1 HBR493Wp [Eremothecium sinecaudum]